MIPPRPVSPPAPSFPWWGLILAGVMAYVAWDAVVRSRHILEVTASYGVTVDAPVSDPQSPTGYAEGRRSLLLPLNAADTHHWIMQTQEMIARGEWRLRRVDYDNVPEGREVHWASPLHWVLAGLAWADHLVSGRPLGVSVERAVLYFPPGSLLVLLAGLTPFLRRWFSAPAAAFFAVGTVATLPFYLDFIAGYTDHHGLANIAGLLTVLLLVVGGRDESRARRWFVVSGLCGGVGLWISSATQAPVLLGVGLGGLAGGWLGRRGKPRPVFLEQPDLFRHWGWAGGAVSFIAYLVEYFPHHLGMRLEVNHPFYALAWIGGGEVLRLIMLGWRDGVRNLPRRDLGWGGAGLGLAALLPLTILFTGTKTFGVSDPFLWRLHANYISEFQGLDRILGKGLSWSTVVLCLPMLWLVPAGWLLARRSLAPGTRAQIALALLPATLGWLMAWSQVRWMSLAFALSVPVVALCFRIGESNGRSGRPSWRWWVGGCLLLLPGAVLAVQRTLGVTEFSRADIQSLVLRDVAHWLRLRGGADRVVVASPPSVTTKLIFHGQLDGVGTLYWENAAGLRRLAELYAAPTIERAREIAGQLGLTHIIFFSWGSFESTLTRLERGLPADAPLPADAFFTRLMSSPVPPLWLRAVPFKLPAHPALEGEKVRIWEVMPEQTPAAALARAANYFLELGRTEEAGRLAPALARYEDDLAATVMRAGIASRQGDQAAFAADLVRVLARLGQADALALDEHLHLVVVLAVGQRLDLARAQLQRAMRKVDERSLRHLSPGTLDDLLALGDAFGVSLPGSGLQELAVRLVTPERRR